MLMIAAAVAIGCLILVGLSYKKLFNQDGALKPFVLQSDGGFYFEQIKLVFDGGL